MHKQAEGLSSQAIVQHEFCSVASGTLLPAVALEFEFLKGRGFARRSCAKERLRIPLADPHSRFRTPAQRELSRRRL